MLQRIFLLIDVWKNHPEVDEILWIQARSKSDTGDEGHYEHTLVPSEDEEDPAERKEETEDSESGDDSDVEYDDDEDEISEPEIAAHNKFAVLDQED